MDKEIPEWIMEAAEKYVGPYQSKHEKGMAESVARFFAEAFRGTGLVREVNELSGRVMEHTCSGCNRANVRVQRALKRATKVRK